MISPEPGRIHTRCTGSLRGFFTCFVFLMLLLITATTTWADSFDEGLPYDPVGARGAAMGGTYPALFSDPSAIYQNPASLVWQKLNLGFGAQPFSWSEPLRSWWLHFYNSDSELKIPIALVLQGWSAPTAEGRRRNIMMGLPMAYGFSPYTPAAIDLKLVAERQENGHWIAGLPIDVGFLARTPRGTTYGIVLRNLTIGSNRLKTMPRRFEYGLSMTNGLLTLSAATYLKSWYKLKAAKDRWHLGAELTSSPQYALRGGMIRIEDRTIYTGGIALKSPGGPFQFSYALTCDLERKNWTHLFQYTYIVQPVSMEMMPIRGSLPPGGSLK